MIKNLTQNHYVGIRYSKEPNEVAKLIYLSKFVQLPNAVDEIVNDFMSIITKLNEQLSKQNLHIDYLIPVWTTKTKTSLPLKLVKKVSSGLNIKYLAEFWEHPQTYNISGKTILIIDDVIQTGKTMAKAIAIVKKYGAANIFFLAYGAANPKFISPTR